MLNQLRQPYTLLLLLLFSITALSQTARYRISVAGFKVGYQIVQQRQNADTLFIFVHSKVHLLMGYEVKYTLHSIFVHNHLLTSEVLVQKNGENYIHTTTKWTGSGYEIVNNGDHHNFSGKILFSNCLLYFYEPSQESIIYSEIDGRNKNFRRTQPDTFQIIDPIDGRVSEYSYKEDVLQETVIHYPLINFCTKLIDHH